MSLVLWMTWNTVETVGFYFLKIVYLEASGLSCGMWDLVP